MQIGRNIRSIFFMGALFLTACTSGKGKVRIPVTEQDGPLNKVGQALCPGNSWDRSFPNRLMKANPEMGLDRWTLLPPKWFGIEVTPVPCRAAKEEITPPPATPAKPAQEPKPKDEVPTEPETKDEQKTKKRTPERGTIPQAVPAKNPRPLQQGTGEL